MILIESFLAATNRRSSPGRAFLGKEGRGFFQDFSFLGDDPQLAPKTTQLVTLAARQALRTAGVDLQLVRPVPPRLPPRPELRSDLRNRPPAAPEQRNRLAAEIHRIPTSHEHHPLAQRQRAQQSSVHETGGPPLPVADGYGFCAIGARPPHSSWPNLVLAGRALDRLDSDD